MASEIKSWQIEDEKLVPVSSSLSESNRREREHLEQWIKSYPSILGDDIAIIGEQVQTSSGFLDFLGIDNSGNTVIVEIKRDMLPREALVQAIDYASDIAGWDLDRFREICLSYTKQTFEDYFQKHFEGISLEDLAINQAQRLLLVGFGIDDSLSRMIEWLSDTYNVGINAVILSYVKTLKGDEILSRMVIIPEEVEKEKANRSKYIIQMSDEPGVYDEATLEAKLIEYLSKNLIMTTRIRDYFIPILLEKGKITRDELRKELIRLGAADDESQAAFHLPLISNQLGYKGKDFLRQVVSYDYPNHPWEKDNFQIRKEYIPLVKSILDKLKIDGKSTFKKKPY